MGASREGPWGTGEMQRAIEDVVLRPDENCLADLNQRPGLEALDLEESPFDYGCSDHHSNISFCLIGSKCCQKTSFVSPVQAQEVQFGIVRQSRVRSVLLN